MRLLFGFFALAASGCAYPEFEFVTEAGVGADVGVVDTSIGDTPSAVETSVVDTGVVPPTDSEVPPCATSGAFCENWDTATTPQGKFKFTIADTGMLGLAAGRSSAKSLQSTIVQTDAGSGSAYLTQPFDVPTETTPIRVDLWVKLESLTYPTTTGYSALFKIEHLGMGAIGDGLAFMYSGGSLYADLYAVKYGHYPLGFMPRAGEWFHVRIDITIHTSAGAVTVWINDMTKPLVSAASVSTARADSLRRNIVIGQYATTPNGTFSVSYDDLAVTLR